MANSLWHYDPKVTNSGDRLYSEMNTGDFWKLGVEYVSKRAYLPTADLILSQTNMAARKQDAERTRWRGAMVCPTWRTRKRVSSHARAHVLLYVPCYYEFGFVPLPKISVTNATITTSFRRRRLFADASVDRLACVLRS
jgi:hypothetical protein